MSVPNLANSCFSSEDKPSMKADPLSASSSDNLVDEAAMELLNLTILSCLYFNSSLRANFSFNMDDNLDFNGCLDEIKFSNSAEAWEI
ncbi:hypothetical protein WICPIJ_009250 [Wickerhamomyces pijperi]|uniref:Uncharacterized protein n=1 Tax=Wickerhamomyces pijperi TaxID=599730 RepID=A0A9P8PPB9_WICPI|nr:hypothetical protein WICPIJ_009250 [Wickerhamomyces pijperi]